MSIEKGCAKGYLPVSLAFLVFICSSNFCLAQGGFNFKKRLFYNPETGQELCFYCRQSPDACKCTCNHCSESVRSNNQQACQCHNPNGAEDICDECMYPRKHCNYYKCRHGLVDTHNSQYTPPLGRIFHPGRSSVVFLENTVAITPEIAGSNVHDKVWAPVEDPCDCGSNYHCLHYRIENEKLFESIESLSEEILEQVHSIFVSQEMSFNFGSASSVSGVSNCFSPFITVSNEYTLRYFIFRVLINGRWHFILIVANNSHALVFYSHQKVIYGYHHTVQAVNEHIITALRRNRSVFLHRIHADRTFAMTNQLVISQVAFEARYGNFDTEHSNSVDNSGPGPKDSKESHENSVSCDFDGSRGEEETSTDNTNNGESPESGSNPRKRTFYEIFGSSDEDDDDDDDEDGEEDQDEDDDDESSVDS